MYDTLLVTRWWLSARAPGVVQLIALSDKLCLEAVVLYQVEIPVLDFSLDLFLHQEPK